MDSGSCLVLSWLTWFIVTVHSTGSGLLHTALMYAYDPVCLLTKPPFHSQNCPALGNKWYGHLTWFYLSCQPYKYHSLTPSLPSSRVFSVWLLTYISLSSILVLTMVPETWGHPSPCIADYAINCLNWEPPFSSFMERVALVSYLYVRDKKKTFDQVASFSHHPHDLSIKATWDAKSRTGGKREWPSAIWGDAGQWGVANVCVTRSKEADKQTFYWSMRKNNGIRFVTL